MNDNTPIPPDAPQPRQPNTPRVWLPIISNFIKTHWVWCGPLIGVAVGAFLVKVL